MGDPPVEGPAQDLPLGLLGSVGARSSATAPARAAAASARSSRSSGSPSCRIGPRPASRRSCAPSCPRTNVGSMPATRVLPTDEARDLLALTRELATRELLPLVGAGRGERDLPARDLPDAGPGRAAGPALPGGVRRRGPALRGLPPGGRGDRVGVGQRRRRGERARAVLLRAGHRRHRGAAPEVAARDARWRAARRLLPLRGPRRVGPVRDDDEGACATATSTSSPGPRRGRRTAARPTSTS